MLIFIIFFLFVFYIISRAAWTENELIIYGAMLFCSCAEDTTHVLMTLRMHADKHSLVDTQFIYFTSRFFSYFEQMEELASRLRRELGNDGLIFKDWEKK